MNRTDFRKFLETLEVVTWSLIIGGLLAGAVFLLFIEEVAR